MEKKRVVDNKTILDKFVEDFCMVIEKHVKYIMTLHGRPVAAIIPMDEVQPAAVAELSAWDELVSLGQQIGQNWQGQQSSTDLLSDMRR